jgi:diguanylate cyclase (GGDEF)-like protein
MKGSSSFTNQKQIELDDEIVNKRASKGVLDNILFNASQTSSHERGQALARVVFTFLASSFFIYLGFDSKQGSQQLIALVFFISSILYLRFISTYTQRFLWRRYLAIVIDLSAASYITWYFGISGLFFYPLFLWIMIGNGLRFGTHHLFVATAVGLLGFTTACWGNGTISNYPMTYLGLLIGLIIMPVFFLVMIKRLANANQVLKEERDKAEHMAVHDSLTSLPNRIFLDEAIEQSIARAERNDHLVAIAFLDLDSFKSINDSFGHEYGDRLLKEIASCLKSALRLQDTVARLGGDEFIILIDYCKDWTTISSVLERIFTCVGRYYQINDYRTFVTLSCGVSVYPKDGDNANTLIKNADTAMYQAKATSPNSYVFYDAEMSLKVGQNLALRDELRSAIELEQFEVYYQPIVDGDRCSVTAVEALIRWHHPERGLVTPYHFIDIAEQTGLIEPIGNWVLQKALEDTLQLRTIFGNHLRIHVNVSAYQLRQEGWSEYVEEQINAAKLPPDTLDLEMTESALINDIEKVELLIANFQKLGVKIALDDFGTGYSSLSYLKRLSVNTIKIDRSFIRDIPQDNNDCSLVDTIITIGAQMGCEVIAEGVETEEQKHWLMEHNCHYMQGYLFSKPVPLDALLNSSP